VDWLREWMLAENNILPSNLDLFTVTGEPAEVVQALGTALHCQARRPA
jgi:hypothetical protein